MRVSLFIVVVDVAIHNESISLWTVAAVTKWKKTAASKLYITSYHQHHHHHTHARTYIVQLFHRFFSLCPCVRFIIFFCIVKKNVSYQAHFYFVRPGQAEQLFVLTFCITCKWVALNALQLTMGITIGIYHRYGCTHSVQIAWIERRKHTGNAFFFIQCRFIDNNFIKSFFFLFCFAAESHV